MNHASSLTSLNAEQQQAVAIVKKHLRVLAGAGSGKTQVIVRRIPWLMEVEKLFPHQFLVVTFTNKAANEMRSRLPDYVQNTYSRLWIGTFHHIAHRILRQHHEAAGLPNNFQILDTADQQRRIKRIIRNLHLDESRFSAKSVQWFINQQKESGLRANQFDASGSKDPYQKALLSIYQAYETSCDQDHVLDFAEILLRSRELLEKNPEILKQYHARFRYILVDEFQDTSRMQYEWIRLLTGPASYVTIVGDDDQSIYGWRGAQIENMHRFERDFPNSETIRLEQNYRSTSTILSAANALIAHNQNRLGKNLWTQETQGDPIQVYAALSDLEETRFIVERIQSAKATGITYQEIAILYRSNAQSRIIEEALLQENIPYRIYGGLRFFDRTEIKDTIAYLRLIIHPDDNGAFDRVINTPTRGLGEKTLNIIRQTAQQESISYYNASQRLLIAAALPTRGAKALRTFLDLINQLRQESQTGSLNQKIENILDKTGLLAHYQKESPDSAQTRLDNLNELVDAARQFVPDMEEEDLLASFLNKITLDPGDHHTESSTTQSVQLMTLHAAKGLEFPVVFLTGLEEGLFPSHLSLNKPSDIEEERRLCYVGMTRAMRQLYFSYAERRAHHGAETYRIPSRFIEEVPTEYLSYIRTPFAERFKGYPSSQPSYPNNANPTIIADTEFRLHQRIHHPSFGEGTIINWEGEGVYTRVQVRFDTVGTKWLILKFAQLEQIA